MWGVVGGRRLGVGWWLGGMCVVLGWWVRSSRDCYCYCCHTTAVVSGAKAASGENFGVLWLIWSTIHNQKARQIVIYLLYPTISDYIRLYPTISDYIRL